MAVLVSCRAGDRSPDPGPSPSPTLRADVSVTEISLGRAAETNRRGTKERRVGLLQETKRPPTEGRPRARPSAFVRGRRVVAPRRLSDGGGGRGAPHRSAPGGGGRPAGQDPRRGRDDSRGRSRRR